MRTCTRTHTQVQAQSRKDTHQIQAHKHDSGDFWVEETILAIWYYRNKAHKILYIKDFMAYFAVCSVLDPIPSQHSPIGHKPKLCIPNKYSQPMASFSLKGCSNMQKAHTFETACAYCWYTCISNQCGMLLIWSLKLQPSRLPAIHHSFPLDN